MRGKISRIIKDKGFGFLTVEGHADVFFHRTALKNVQFDELKVGQELEFDVEDSGKGPRAEDVYA